MTTTPYVAPRMALRKKSPHTQVGESSASCAALMLPAALADVALITAPTCAAVGDMSTSWWHAEVANLRAPQPVIRGPRCTRWRLSDVVAYWADRAARGTDAEVTELVNAKARKASAAAKAKRRVVPAPAEA